MKSIEEMVQATIPYFIKVYGEEYAPLIMERLNNTKVYFYSTLEEKSRAYYKLKEKEQEKLSFDFLDQCGISVPLDIKENGVTSLKEKLPEAYEFIYWIVNHFLDSFYKDIFLYSTGVK